VEESWLVWEDADLKLEDFQILYLQTSLRSLDLNREEDFFSPDLNELLSLEQRVKQQWKSRKIFRPSQLYWGNTWTGQLGKWVDLVLQSSSRGYDTKTDVYAIYTYRETATPWYKIS